MIEIVHHDGRCIKGTPDAVIIAERETAGYNPVTIANQFPKYRYRTSRRIASRGLALRRVVWDILKSRIILFSLGGLYNRFVVEIVANDRQFTMLAPDGIVIPNIAEAVSRCVFPQGLVQLLPI